MFFLPLKILLDLRWEDIGKNILGAFYEQYKFCLKEVHWAIVSTEPPLVFHLAPLRTVGPHADRWSTVSGTYNTCLKAKACAVTVFRWLSWIWDADDITSCSVMYCVVETWINILYAFKTELTSGWWMESFNAETMSKMKCWEMK